MKFEVSSAEINFLFCELAQLKYLLRNQKPIKPKKRKKNRIKNT
jgi:hypothetical protein